MLYNNYGIGIVIYVYNLDGSELHELEKGSTVVYFLDGIETEEKKKLEEEYGIQFIRMKFEYEVKVDENQTVTIE